MRLIKVTFVDTQSKTPIFFNVSRENLTGSEEYYGKIYLKPEGGGSAL